MRALLLTALLLTACKLDVKVVGEPGTEPPPPIDRDDPLAVPIELPPVVGNGDTMWGLTLGGDGSDAARAIAIDARGASHVAGTIGEMAQIEDIVIDATDDAFVLVLDADGVPQWASPIGGDGTHVASSVTVSAGSTWVAGWFDGDLGGQASIGMDAFVVRFDENGIMTAAMPLALPGEQQIVAMDAADDDVIVAGNSSEASLPGCDAGGFIARINVGWCHSVAGTTLTDIAVADSAVHVVGYSGADAYHAELTIDGVLVDEQTIVNQRALAVAARAGEVVVGGSMGGDAYIMRDGEVTQLGGDGDQRVTALAIDQDGFVLAMGAFNGPTELDETLESAGEDDVFVVKLDATGTAQWSHRYGRNTEDRPGGIAVDSDGHTLIAGGFADGIQLGDTVHSTDGDDAFVAKLDR